MFLIGLIVLNLFLIFNDVSGQTSISCSFLDVNDDYKCDMFLYNEDGYDEFTVINGGKKSLREDAE